MQRKLHINFKPSDLTRRQLEWLAQRWGIKPSEVIKIAIDRAYHQERQETGEPVIHVDKGRVQVGLWHYDPETRTRVFRPATNWEELEDAAIEVLHAESIEVDLADLFPCPPEIAERAKFPKA